MLYCKCKSKFRLSQLYLFIYTVYCDFYFNFCLSVSKVVSVNNIYKKFKIKKIKKIKKKKFGRIGCGSSDKQVE